VAFCGISTGVFRFPKIQAAEIAVQTVTDWLGKHPDKMERIIFAVLSDKSREIYEQIFS
jgi:O-acetyl-ADP-ribose deacetylase (regulator of RNase III)